MYVVVICVSRTILASSDFFFDPVEFGNTILGALFVAALVLHHSCVHFQPSFVPHSHANSELQALYFCPLDVSAPRLPAVASRQTPPTLPTADPIPPTPQIRARRDFIQHPTLRPYPGPRHPLIAPDPLLLYVFISRNQADKGAVAPRSRNGRRHAPKSRTSFSTTFSIRSSR
jgi:hypothetical protein